MKYIDNCTETMSLCISNEKETVSRWFKIDQDDLLDWAANEGMIEGYEDGYVRIYSGLRATVTYDLDFNDNPAYQPLDEWLFDLTKGEWMAYAATLAEVDKWLFAVKLLEFLYLINTYEAVNNCLVTTHEIKRAA